MRKLYLFLMGMCMLITQLVYSQATSISGTVVDGSGQPIVGASVKVKGTKTGTVSDANGMFSLKVNPGQKLVVSAVGYAEQEFSASQGMSVKLNQDVTANGRSNCNRCCRRYFQEKNDCIRYKSECRAIE